MLAGSEAGILAPIITGPIWDFKKLGFACYSVVAKEAGLFEVVLSVAVVRPSLGNCHSSLMNEL